MEDETSLPPCGGSGLKLLAGAIAASLSASPSMRREWIEMQTVQTPQNPAGSPSMRREWIEICMGWCTRCPPEGLPPCGGSGLKFPCPHVLKKFTESPSMRREWIEMGCRVQR